MQVKIEVTKEDIENGIRCSGASCPIAHATNRALDYEKEVAISSHFIAIWGTPFISVKLPNLVEWRIRLYDYFGWMRPFSFVINLPDKYIYPPINATPM